MTSRPADRGLVRTRWRDQLVALTWLVFVWNLLWGGFSWGNVIGGLLVALTVLAVFPLPPVTFRGRVRPVRVLAFLLRFVADLVTASARVAWLAVRPAPPPRSAIIAVPLRVRSDLNLALTAEALTLVPGSLIVEADPRTGTLYVHVLGLRGPQDVAPARRSVLQLEARIVAAIGSAAELRQVQAADEE